MLRVGGPMGTETPPPINTLSLPLAPPPAAVVLSVELEHSGICLASLSGLRSPGQKLEGLTGATRDRACPASSVSELWLHPGTSHTLILDGGMD